MAGTLRLSARAGWPAEASVRERRARSLCSWCDPKDDANGDGDADPEDGGYGHLGREGTQNSSVQPLMERGSPSPAAQEDHDDNVKAEPYEKQNAVKVASVDHILAEVKHRVELFRESETWLRSLSLDELFAELKERAAAKDASICTKKSTNCQHVDASMSMVQHLGRINATLFSDYDDLSKIEAKKKKLDQRKLGDETSKELVRQAKACAVDIAKKNRTDKAKENKTDTDLAEEFIKYMSWGKLIYIPKKFDHESGQVNYCFPAQLSEEEGFHTWPAASVLRPMGEPQWAICLSDWARESILDMVDLYSDLQLAVAMQVDSEFDVVDPNLKRAVIALTFLTVFGEFSTALYSTVRNYGATFWIIRRNQDMLSALKFFNGQVLLKYLGVPPRVRKAFRTFSSKARDGENVNLKHDMPLIYSASIADDRWKEAEGFEAKLPKIITEDIGLLALKLYIAFRVMHTFTSTTIFAAVVGLLGLLKDIMRGIAYVKALRAHYKTLLDWQRNVPKVSDVSNQELKNKENQLNILRNGSLLNWFVLCDLPKPRKVQRAVETSF